jgi:hypothetical protein
MNVITIKALLCQIQPKTKCNTCSIKQRKDPFCRCSVQGSVPAKSSHQPHGRVSSSLPTNKHTHTHKDMQRHTHTHAHTHIYAHTYAHTHTHEHTHAHTHTHTHTHTHARAHTHAHARTPHTQRRWMRDLPTISIASTRTTSRSRMN